MMQMIVPSRVAMIIVCATALGVLGCCTAAAQSTGAGPQTPTPPAIGGQPRVGPALGALPVAVQAAASPTASAVASTHSGQRQNETLMVVGGAAILVGAVMGGKAGTVFMVGGAVAGLYGLYKYMQ
jgi:hypothetical protein